VSDKFPKSNDRRVQRTRRTLRESLISLMLERSCDEISVQDVCDKADVGRSTFYTHFADKEELMAGGFEDLRRMLRAGLAERPDGKVRLGFARGMIDHAHDNQRLFRALVGKKSGQVVLRQFRELVGSLVREDLAATCVHGPAMDAAVHFIAGGFLDLLTWWLEARNPLQPPDIERLFLEMARPAIGLVTNRIA